MVRVRSVSGRPQPGPGSPVSLSFQMWRCAGGCEERRAGSGKLPEPCCRADHLQPRNCQPRACGSWTEQVSPERAITARPGASTPHSIPRRPASPIYRSRSSRFHVASPCGLEVCTSQRRLELTLGCKSAARWQLHRTTHLRPAWAAGQPSSACSVSLTIPLVAFKSVAAAHVGHGGKADQTRAIRRCLAVG